MEVQGSEIRAPCLIFGEAVWLSGKPLNLRVNKLYGYMILFGCVTSLWKEIDKTYIRSQNYYRTCIALGMKWDDAQKAPCTVPGLPWIFSEGTSYSVPSAILHNFQNNFGPSVSESGRTYWIEDQTLRFFFCSAFAPDYSCLEPCHNLDLLASTTSDICCWPNLCWAGLAATNSSNSALLPSGAAWRRR